MATRDLRELAVELLVTSARFTRFVAQEAGGDVPKALWRLMGVLDERGSSRISDLALADRCSQPTMTSLVQRLAQHGWVSRSVDPDDRRATLVALTPAGLAALNSEREKAGERLAPHLEHLTEEEREVIERAVTLVHRFIAEGPLDA